MDFAFWFQLLAPAAAAYVSTRVGIAIATERANEATRLARHAHKRIDDIIMNG